MRSTVAAVLVYLGLTMAAVGASGLAFEYGQDDEPADDPAAASTSTPPPETPTSPSGPPIETSETFFGLFTEAVTAGDRDFLFERLHPAVIERYGRAQCREATRQLVDSEALLQLVDVQPPAGYEYASDGQRTVVAGTATFVVDGTVAGQTGRREYHFPLVGGRYRIFLDCGEPRAGGG